MAWLSFNALVSINVVKYSTSGPVSTWMGDRLWVGKPSRYVTSHLGQLSLSSIPGYVHRVTAFLVGLEGVHSPVSGDR